MVALVGGVAVAAVDGVVVPTGEEGEEGVLEVAAGTVPSVVDVVPELGTVEVEEADVLAEDPLVAPGDGAAGTEGAAAPTGATPMTVPITANTTTDTAVAAARHPIRPRPDLWDLAWAHTNRITADSLAQPRARVSSPLVRLFPCGHVPHFLTARDASARTPP
ncbi:MAG TPA: hypothetical protein VHU17_07305 [Acidimicrobiales bacterium]|nr:hypothetical protein [Acidimicrobiales bacterium]